MGSLLLLLFIMDRKAKIASQHQVSAMHAERKKRTKDEEDARSAEWEKAKEKLRQTLLAQQGQLDFDAKGIHGQLDDVGKKLLIVHARHEDLAKQVKNETAKIGAIQLQIAGQQTSLAEAAKNEGASKKDLRDAAKELADLETAFLAMRALKDRATPVYSLVPYRGKRGAGRPPIYVECVRGGVLFHPDRKELTGLDFSPASVRAEVERHAGPLVTAKTSKDKMREPPQEKAGPYVLFLIRPDGIASYYKASSALAGFQLDFGYELVDQDWVLDFNGDPNAKRAQPIQVAWPNEPSKSPSMIAVPPLVDSPSGIPPSLGGIAPPPLGANAQEGVRPPGALGAPPSYGGGPAFVPSSKFAPPVPIASTENPSKSPGSQGVSPINAPIPGNSVSAQRPANEGAPIESNAKAPLPAGETPRKTPTPARTLGERDFVITIDCYGEHVNVFPGGMPFRWTSSNTQATDRAFVDAVVNLIVRRQASVRPGETPYRPVIRFQVSPTGLRTYLHTYPLLERLGVPMTRENVED